MKKVYGKFCSRHNEAVNFYKELHAKDKRFQAFIKVGLKWALSLYSHWDYSFTHFFTHCIWYG